MTVSTSSNDLRVNPPKQERSRLAWVRVLDAGVEIIEAGGYEAFTIAAVCERAEVSIPSIYARTKSKEALFLAVYDHKLSAIDATEVEVFEHSPRWRDLSDEGLVREAVREVGARFLDHGAFLRVIVNRSAVDPEIRRRGKHHVSKLSKRFCSLVLEREISISHADPHRAADATFRMLFASLTAFVSYGPLFMSDRDVSAAELVADLEDVAVAYLL